MREKYESLSLAVLKDLAKARGMKGISTLRKGQLIEAMLTQDEKDKAAADAEAGEQEEKKEIPAAPIVDEQRKKYKKSEKRKKEDAANHAAESDEETVLSRATEPDEKSDVNPVTDPEQSKEAETPADSGMSEFLPNKDSLNKTPENILQNTQENTLQNTIETMRETPSAAAAPAKMRVQGSGKNEAAANIRQDAARTDDRPYRAARSYGQTEDQGRQVQRRRKLPESSGRTTYDRGSTERRTYDRSRTKTDQNNSDSNRRSYGDQGNSYENRRNYGEQNDTLEYRGSTGTQEERTQTQRSYIVSGDSAEKERNDAEQSYAAQNHVSETRRGYDEGGERVSDSGTAQNHLTDIDRPPAEFSQLDSGQSVSGILEVMPDGYGFIRSDNYLPGDNDVYVSPSQIRRFNLKTGDIISGNTRIKSQQEKFSALLYLKKINELAPSEAMRRYNFEDMTPVFPDERLRMEREPRGIAMRIVDLFSPIGKGQRGMIVSPPKAGKTTLLKDIARSILKNNPEMRLLILLIDERPEEVTDIREAICGENVEVIYSTFDETPEHHKRVSEMVIERAKRLVEQKQDVTILLDSITRLARAYNLTVPPSGRTLSGGLDPAALHMPKRFFGAARNMREGGSLTILATALVDTGSKMDDVVYEEFKGTGNMELVLDRKLSERRIFPAIDIPKSSTRREDLLLDREEQEAMYYMRRALNGMKSDDAVESILNLLTHTRDNRDFVTRVRRQKGV